jgi:hypothetical protein
MGGSSDGPAEFAFGAHGPCEDGKPVFPDQFRRRVVSRDLNAYLESHCSRDDRLRRGAEARLVLGTRSASAIILVPVEERYMTKITYEIVEHDGGWAYRADGVFSETFPSHDLARKAAERAAKEQAVPGETTGISYEDKDGRWHDEVARGNDRPETDVEG